MLRSLLVAFAITFVNTISTSAQTFTTKDLDARIEKQLFDVLTLGTDIYNRGSHDACYRLYQGSLMAVMGFLDHRPDQQLKISKALKATDQINNVSERAFSLRTAIDDLREAIKPTLTGQPAAPSGRPTLWYRLGGESSITQMVDEVVNRSMKNPRINFTRGGTGNQWEANPENLSKVKRQFVLWLSSTTGGPFKFEGKDIKTSHQNMKITAAEYDAFILEIKATLDKYFVPNAESTELLAVFDRAKKEIVDSTVVIKSLWDRLGGEPAITLVVDDFMTRAARNPSISISLKEDGNVWKATPAELTALKKHLVHWLSSQTQGPLKYEGKSLSSLQSLYRISNAQFTTLMLELKASLEQLKINEWDREELLSTVSGIRKNLVDSNP